ncbi:MAG: glycosyltransferase family 39 protein [Phycisphaerae bacterium]
MNQEVNTNKAHLMDLLLIVVLCIAFFGYRLGSFVPLTDHEGYVAVTAQEALDGGNWIVPHFDGQIRLQKTPLMYWTVALLGAIYGDLNEFVIRLPSVLAAAGIAVLLTMLGAKMFTRVTGLMIGLATASATGMLWQSHVGTADMLMTFFVVASMFFAYLGFAAIEEGKSGFGNWILAYIAFGLGMLAKGPVPVIAVVMPLFFYLLWAGFWKYFKKIHFPTGLVIFLIIVGAWVVPVLIKVPDAAWRWKAEYFERYLGDFGTERPWHYYFSQIFLLTLPWSCFLPIGLVLAFRKEFKGKRHEMIFLFCWLVAGFVVFSVGGGKRAHYILPIVPPAIMLSVVGMIYSLEQWLSRRVIAVASAAIMLLSAAGFWIGYGYIKANFPQVTYNYQVLAYVLLLAEVLTLISYFRVHLLAAVTVIALATGIGFAIIWPLYPKVTDIARDPRMAADRFKQAVGSDATIYSIGKANGPLIFYYGKRMPQIPEDREVAQIFKAKNTDVAIANLEEVTTQKVLKLVQQPKCVYFVSSDTRFAVAQYYGKEKGLGIYEILRLPGFFSTDKSLVLFSNCPKKK